MQNLQAHKRRKSSGLIPKKQYMIEFQPEQKYPFSGQKPSIFSVSVSTRFCKTSSGSLQNNIDKITQVSLPIFIQILQIVETRSSQLYYTLKYQYVPYSILNHPDKIVYSQYQNSIHQICQELARLQINIDPTIQDFGFSNNQELKYFLRPNFTNIKLDTDGKSQRFIKEMKQKFEYAFIMGTTLSKQLKNSQQSDKNMEAIAQKIRKLRHNLFKVQMKNHEYKAVKKNQCISEKNPSDNSENNTHTITKQEAGFQQSRISSEKQPFFEDSYSWRDAKIKKKRTSSFQLDDKKPKSESKYKKGSWAEKCSNVQSDKATVLKKRVSDALLKTQNTLNKYEKIRTKSSRKIK